MTSQLNVDTIVDKAGSGGSNVKMANTSTYVSDGGAVTQNTVQGLAKCWLASSDAAGLNDSLNITSGTDNGTGDYTFAISNDMANSNYSIISTASQAAANDPVISCNPTNDTNSVSVFRLQLGYTSSGSGGYVAIDKLNYSALFGDLA